MNMNLRVKRLTLVSTLVAILILVIVAATAQIFSGKAAYVDEHWFDIITGADEQLVAFQEHNIDAGCIPRPTDLPTLGAAGFTITAATRLGQNLLLMNNRVWPFGGVTDPYTMTGTGSPTDPCYTSATNLRKAVNRLINPACLALYAPLKSVAGWWLPPGQSFWINPACPLPTYNPGTWNDTLIPGVCETASAYLNAGNFTTTGPNIPRVDPLGPDGIHGTEDDGTTSVCFTYYAIGPAEDPLGWEMAQCIHDTLEDPPALLTVTLIQVTRLGLLIRLINPTLTDYQMMSGVNLFWGTTAPDILYDLTYSGNTPLWNLVGMNIPAMDAQCEQMMSSPTLAGVGAATFGIQTQLDTYEPYRPLLVDEGFAAFTGPYENEPGYIGIVNEEGVGALGYSANIGLLSPRGQSYASNVWAKMLGRSGRYDPTNPVVDINQWGLPAYLDTLNPLTADSGPDWQILSLVEDTLFKRNPYTMEYMWWAAEGMPTTEEWIGPGRSQIGGNEVYNNAYNGTHYACVGANGVPQTPQPTPYVSCRPITAGGDDVVLPIGPGPYTCSCGTYGPYAPPYAGANPGVVWDDLADDDQLGMVTTWTLRPGMYWHDSDPGPDMTFGTADDGAVYPVTAADAEFCLNLLRFQRNIRYNSTWWFLHCVEIVDDYTFKVLEERRYPFAFESHSDAALLIPEHIWRDFILPTYSPDRECILPCGSITYGAVWNDWTNHHEEWTGWEGEYMQDPTDWAGRQLTYLIGFGPFKYHHGGWEPGVSAHVATNPCYFADHICPAEIDFNQRCEPATDDIYNILAKFGPFPTPAYPTLEQLRADTCYPAQVIELSELLQFDAHSGHYWGPDPVPSGFERCEEIP